MTSLITNRLILEEFVVEDAPFILELLNDPAFLRFIGDRHVRTIADAEEYILHRLRPDYERFGFGFYITRLNENRVPIGLCGLVKRDRLEDVDVGFAFLPAYRGDGYAFEAAAAVIDYGINQHHLTRIIAVTDPDNTKSIRLLEKLGLSYEKNIIWDDGFELKQFALEV